MCALAVCPYTANVLAHIKAARQPLVARVTTDVQREVNQQMCSVRFNKGLDIMKEPVSAYSSPAFELEKAVGSEGVIDIYLEEGIKNPDISILSEEFLE